MTDDLFIPSPPKAYKVRASQMVAWRCFCRIWPEYPRTDNKVGAWRRFRALSGFKKLAEDILE
ncbi:MAG: hypothetical protein GY722_22895, partial [bacterium]|nr:hypothetical protein [bacterium]